MAKAAGAQKYFLSKEANIISSKAQDVAEKPQEIKKKSEGVVVWGRKPSVQAVATANANQSAFTFNPSNQQCKNGDEETLEYDSSIDNASASSFDFHKDRAANRSPIGPLSKPAPSKWDDAEKWLARASSAESTSLKRKPKSGFLQGVQVLNRQAAPNHAKKAQITRQVRQFGNAGGSHAPRAAPVPSGIAANSPESLEISLPSERIKFEGLENVRINAANASVELMKRVETNKYISDQGEGASKFSFMASETQLAKTRSLDNSIDLYPLDDAFDCGQEESKDVPVACIRSDAHEMLKPTLRTQKPTTEFPTGNSMTLNVNNFDPSSSPLEVSYLPPTTVKPVSMRDMGTEMTPIASQEPSRTATPNRATTPTLRSPASSCPSTPGRATPTPSPLQQTSDVNIQRKETESKVQELSEKESQDKTRQEILALGTQLGKANITAWATQEDADASKSLKNIGLEEVKKKVLETRVAAWEEAEKSKYMARYKREEAKIQAWENHENAKAEAEMSRIEVKVERMRSNSQEIFMNKLVATRRRVEKLHATAEARRGEQVAKITRHAGLIRHTRKMPYSFSFCSFC